MKKIISILSLALIVCVVLSFTTTLKSRNSNVPEERGDFPEMDDYKWVTIDEARGLIHETQVACLDKVKQLFSR